jgi:hypothetical protein
MLFTDSTASFTLQNAIRSKDTQNVEFLYSHKMIFPTL